MLISVSLTQQQRKYSKLELNKYNVRVEVVRILLQQEIFSLLL